MAKYTGLDRYTDPETGVLKNKLGITDNADLEQQEADFAAVRSYQLSQHPIRGQFDLHHLQAIHKHLFSDLYEWAGEIRDVDIIKGQTRFANHQHITTAASRLFEVLAKENYLAELDKTCFSQRLAYYLGEINALHPFRDGNGRTQREYINQLAAKNGYLIV